jgi:hypothetical protein
VEAAPHNVGKMGKYKGVGAHLFAIACKLSWDAGNEGYVQFTAKTDMIVAERKVTPTLDMYDNFGNDMLDGRLTEPSDGKVYRLREAILYSKQLGRTLTPDEMKQFEYTTSS